MLHHPFLFKEKPTQAQEVAGRISGAVVGEVHTKSRLVSRQLANFWCRCRGDLHQAYQVPIINSHLLRYIILHSPLVFLSPTSKMIFKKICLFICPSSVRLFVCPYVLLGLFPRLLGIIVCSLKIRSKEFRDPHPHANLFK